TRAETALEDAQVATRALAVTRAQLDEQSTDGFLVPQAGKGEAAVGDTVLLGQGDQRLRNAAQLLGLGKGGTDRSVLDEGRGHVGEHRIAMGTGAAEFASGFLVAHGLGS